jgi:hypothetical protein
MTKQIMKLIDGVYLEYLNCLEKGRCHLARRLDAIICNALQIMTDTAKQAPKGKRVTPGCQELVFHYGNHATLS